VLHDLPGVGQDLRDHLYVRMQHRVRGTQSMNERTRGWRLAVELTRYALAGEGLMANATTSGALFCRSRPELAAPDLYISFTPGSYAQQGELEREPGMAIGILKSHPESVGSIRLRSSDPAQQPAIAPNYLSAEEDRRATVVGLRIVRKLFAAPSLARWSAGETRPGPQATTDDDLLAFARERATTGLHFTTTCRMGIDPMAVVSPELKVHGVEGLRVIDASVMPGCSSGNTHAPTLMIGEKGADLILNSAAT
jgi:choline dehydrogenase